MPPLPPPGAVIEFKAHYEPGPDLHVYAREFFKYTGSAPAIADCNAFASKYSSAFATNLASLLYSGDALFDVTSIDLSSATGNTGFYGTSVVGSRAGTQVPNSCPVLINLKIQRRYRGGKPKLFLPFGVQADLNNPVSWTNTFANAVTAGYAAFLTSMNGYTSGATTIGARCNVSWYQGFTVVTNPTTGRARNVPKLRAVPLVDTVLSATASTVIGAQRRRLRP